MKAAPRYQSKRDKADEKRQIDSQMKADAIQRSVELNQSKIIQKQIKDENEVAARAEKAAEKAFRRTEKSAEKAAASALAEAKAIDDSREKAAAFVARKNLEQLQKVLQTVRSRSSMNSDHNRIRDELLQSEKNALIDTLIFSPSLFLPKYSTLLGLMRVLIDKQATENRCRVQQRLDRTVVRFIKRLIKMRKVKNISVGQNDNVIGRYLASACSDRYLLSRRFKGYIFFLLIFKLKSFNVLHLSSR